MPTDAEAAPAVYLYELAAAVTDRYVRAGFSVVAQDIVIPEQLEEMVAMIRSRPQTPAETVAEILDRAPDQAAVSYPHARRP